MVEDPETVVFEDETGFREPAVPITWFASCSGSAEPSAGKGAGRGGAFAVAPVVGAGAGSFFSTFPSMDMEPSPVLSRLQKDGSGE
jgi:hypothetical protein